MAKLWTEQGQEYKIILIIITDNKFRLNVYTDPRCKNVLLESGGLRY